MDIFGFGCLTFTEAEFFHFAFQFELGERKRARTEYEKMLFRQEMEAEELRVSSESALKELQQLQVSDQINEISFELRMKRILT